jgi:hypothetical protein
MEQLFNTASKQPKAVRTKIGKFAMMLANVFTTTMGVNSVEMIEFGECSDKVKNYMLEKINNTNDPLFEKLAHVNEEDSRMKIYIYLEKKWIKECVVIAENSKEQSICLIRISGKIEPEKWQDIIKKQKHGSRDI